MRRTRPGPAGAALPPPPHARHPAPVAGRPARGSAPALRRLVLRFSPGPAAGTTQISYAAELALQGPLEAASWAASPQLASAAEAAQAGLEACFRKGKHSRLVPAPGSNQEQRELLAEVEAIKRGAAGCGKTGAAERARRACAGALAPTGSRGSRFLSRARAEAAASREETREIVEAARSREEEHRRYCPEDDASTGPPTDFDGLLIQQAG